MNNNDDLINPLDDDETKIKKFQSNPSVGLATSIKDDSKKIGLIKAFNLEFEKIEVLSSIKDNNVIIKAIDESTDPEEKIILAKGLNGDEAKLSVLPKFNDQDKLEIIKRLKSYAIIEQSFDYFDNKKTSEIMKNLLKDNHEIIRTLNYKILDDKYISLFGEDKINSIATFYLTQQQILNLNDNQLKIFANCIKNYESNPNNHHWKSIAKNILNNIKGYSNLLENLKNEKNINYEKLTKILQTKNLFNLEKIEDFKNFDQFRIKECNKLIESNNLQDRKQAVLYKLFGQDEKYVQSLIEKFGDDIENIDDSDEKDYIRCLIEIDDSQNLDVLKEIYNNVDQLDLIDPTIMERQLKSAYLKKYNDILLQTDTLEKFDQDKLPDKLKGLKVFDAGTDFNIIMTSISPYVIHETPKDFKENWNRPSKSSRSFLCKFYQK